MDSKQSDDERAPGKASRPVRNTDEAGAKASREERLAEALRANLRRRKAATKKTTG
ncbi:hypothetical protein [Roseibium sp. RKSG952]|uniref:hypothetical protein n=1 Tax=Roseibium sp. RKSG952 TaxID=2529384 RepID=UPI0018AD1083|nr:hypothetical protein [Roseibium sp. RKSG952]